MSRVRTFLFALAALFLLSCKQSAPPSAPSKGPASQPAASVTLVVSVAASMTDVIKQGAEQFSKANRGVRISTNIGATGQLTEQILKGAPADVLVSADTKWVTKLIEQQEADVADRKPLAGNRLVLVRPSANTVPTAIADLSEKAVTRIAIGDPKLVPAGAFAQKILTDAGLWETVQAKLVPGENVRQALTYVERGEVDAGFVYATDVRGRDGVAVVASWDLPERNYEAIVIGDSAHAAEARRFVEYLGGDQFRSLLKDAGFVVD